MGVCNCSMFCCTLLCVRSSIAIILMGKRKLVALLDLSSRYLVMVERLFLAVPQVCLRLVIVVFPDNTNLLLLLSGLSSCERNLRCKSISICDGLSANALVYIHLFCYFVLMP